MNGDPKGHELLGQRIGLAREAVFGLLNAPGMAPLELSGAGVVATGVGSSEAHARFLVGLLNAHTSIPAEFVSLSSFDGPGIRTEWRRARTLVVFSQGLAPNARLALDRVEDFAGCVLVTAATVEGQERSGRRDRAGLLRRLERGGVRVERIPMEDEYTLLVRVIGPACGFAAALRLVAAVPGNGLGPVSALIQPLQSVAEGPWPGRVTAWMDQSVGRGEGDCVLVLPPGLAGFAQNLSAKFVEGLYGSPPRIVETLELAHGTFQQLMARRVPVWVLGSDPLSIRARDMLGAAGLAPVHVPLEVPGEAMPLAAEFLFNPALAHWARELDRDLVNWPGKGLDGALYNYTGPSPEGAG